MQVQGTVGPFLQAAGPGSNPTMRQGALQEVIVSELNARLYELNKSGQLFQYAGAVAATAFAATHATATLGATATPIVGLWNPASSTVNLVVIKAFVHLSAFGVNSAATPGGFTWVASTGNAAVSAGATPFSAKTMAQAGSQAKAWANGTGAITGLTNTMALVRPSAIGCPIGIQPSAFGVSPSMLPEENIDGSIIVPPGGMLALLSNVSVTAPSFNSGLVWGELPL